MNTSDKIASVALAVAIVSSGFSWYATQTANRTSNLSLVIELSKELDYATLALVGALDRAASASDIVTPALEWEKRFQTVKGGFESGIEAGTVDPEDWKNALKGPCDLFGPIGFITGSDGTVLLATLQQACRQEGLT